MNSEVVLDLEQLAWPALLVDMHGSIHQANAAAKKLFEPALNQPNVSLTSLWSSENQGTATDFLAGWRQSQAAFVTLKFQVASGATTPFTTAICPAGGQEKPQLVIQLLPGVPAAVGGAAPGEPAALKQKLDCMLQLAQTVSLDFNNALTGVLAHTSLLLGKTEQDHPWRFSLMEVEKSAVRAAEIAAELANFSRQEKKSRRVPMGNLNAVVTRCVGFLRKAHGARFAWNLMLERYLFEARFDDAKVEQAVAKILDNALESFGRADTGPIIVQTRNVQLTEATQDRNVRLVAGTYICAEIADGGAGIETEVMPRIFEPFFTTKPAPHRGLGLALVYGIMSNHGGGVAISSQPGKGTSVRLYLPAETTHIREVLTSTDSLTGSGTVLVVDDENLLLTMAETILSNFGYTVLTAPSGAAALRFLSDPNQKIDLVITDMVMPGMGGRELMDRIRQMGLPVPILCTSGYVLSEEARSVTGYLPKPFTSSELLAKVKNVISRNEGS
jgi:two-component system cell cycle sensor histidine kinase/response regulator CckA